MAENYHALVFEGSTSVDRVAKFRDTIQQAAKEHLHLLIDLSEIDSLPTISGAIIGDLMTKLRKSYYHIAIINAEVLGDSFMQKHSATETFQYFENYTQADHYFDTHPVKVLVVEDEDITARLIEDYLQNRNMVVVRAESGEDAIDLSQSEMPYLILMDIHLPNMNGIEAAQYIRGHQETMDIPIIILSSDSDRDKVVSAKELNVEGYILKPFDPKTFFRKILSVLSGTN